MLTLAEKSRICRNIQILTEAFGVEAARDSLINIRLLTIQGQDMKEPKREEVMAVLYEEIQKLDHLFVRK